MHLSDGEVLATRTFIWRAGVRPAPIASLLGAACDTSGRILVDECLAVVGRPDTFAAGDAAAVPDPVGQRPAAPMTAQYALREGRACARNVAASLGVGAPRPFRYRERGLLMHRGVGRGVGRLWGLPLSGVPGWFTARGYTLLAMPSPSRQIRVALDWAVGLTLPRVDIADLTELR